MSAKGSRAKCLAESMILAGSAVETAWAAELRSLARPEQDMKSVQEATELAVEARAGMLSAIWSKTDMAPSRAPWVKPRVKAAGLLRSDQTVCRGPGSLSMMVDWKAGATELAAELSAWTTWERPAIGFSGELIAA
jgi:hypothetical protein